jgi:AcrR family transcriptional regulator
MKTGNHPAKTNAYHHGNLRQSLVDSAVAILEQEGVPGLSLRAVAKASGVSQAAPYSHFSNKQSLLAEVARVGYVRFCERMARELDRDDNRLVGLGKGYVFFALENPALFHLMFSGELAQLVNVDEIDDAFLQGYQMLVDVIAENPLTQFGSDLPHLDTAYVWSVVHGIATLILGNQISAKRYNLNTDEELVEKMLEKYFSATEEVT